MKILERLEWSQEQREFLESNPQLAIKAEEYLNDLDLEIAYLEEKQRRNPIWRIKQFFKKFYPSNPNTT